MTTYQMILFDLDGTLTDPKIGITRSVQYALEQFGIIEDNLDNLEHFIGPPLIQSFQESYHFSEEQAHQAITAYRKYFSVTGLYENNVYPGIPQLLAALYEKEIKMVVATSKPTLFAERILSHFHLDCYFDTVIGSHLDGRRTDKTEIIQDILSRYASIDKQSIVMVGDRKFDSIGAKQNGIDSIGVGYGYGSQKEWEEFPPTIMAQTVEELTSLLLKSSV